MELNSKAGYYTSKSPEMHLAEHLQRSKKPRARYVPKQLENGKWTCKVRLTVRHAAMYAWWCTHAYDVSVCYFVRGSTLD